MAIALLAGALGAVVGGMAILTVLVPGFLTLIYSLALGKRSYILNRIIHEEASAEATDPSPSDARFKAERDVALTTIEVAASITVLVGGILSMSALIGAATVASFGIAPLVILITGVGLGLACKTFDYIDDKHDCKYSKKIRDVTAAFADLIKHQSKIFFRHDQTECTKPAVTTSSDAMIITKTRNTARNNATVPITLAEPSHQDFSNMPRVSLQAADPQYSSLTLPQSNPEFPSTSPSAPRLAV